MIGIVADDITGANDIGAMFAMAGYETLVITETSGESAADLRLDGRPDVVIVDTNSRYFSPDNAYLAILDATRRLYDLGCTRFFKKTCSVFRGNVGREFDAMMDALGPETAPRMIVVPGYPSNQRTTRHGIQYVFDKPLAESHFRNDPVHPMTSSNIVDILRGQTTREVMHVDIAVVEQGAAALRDRLESANGKATYILLDVDSETSLRSVAEATRDERVFGGSAGLASQLAPLWRPGGKPAPAPAIARRKRLGIPVVAGSLTPVTAEQVARVERRGGTRVEIDPMAVLDTDARGGEVARLARETASALGAGRDAILITPSAPGSVDATLAEAGRLGLSDAEAGRRISDALGSATQRALSLTGQNRLLAAGGDTSAAVCAHLGVRSLRIGLPIEPGLPLCTGLSEPPVRLVLKGGSMGTPDFIVNALDALRAS